MAKSEPAFSVSELTGYGNKKVDMKNPSSAS
jgi:hypothetical protein